MKISQTSCTLNYGHYQRPDNLETTPSRGINFLDSTPEIILFYFCLLIFSEKGINVKFFIKNPNCKDSSNHHISPTLLVAYHPEGINSGGVIVSISGSSKLPSESLPYIKYQRAFHEYSRQRIFSNHHLGRSWVRGSFRIIIW